MPDPKQITEITYLHANFAVVMCDEKKIAVQKHSKVSYQKADLDAVWFNHNTKGMTAILCGGRSNNLEILDFDLKNAKNPQQFMVDFANLVAGHISQAFVDNMIVQQTPSGGYHWIYQTDHVGGNKKLSKGENGKAIVETRGEGGYFIVAPSTNYHFIQGNMESVPVITKEEKSELWLCAKLLEEYDEPEIIRKQDIAKHSALENTAMSNDGQVNYWQEFDHKCDYLTLLEADGWTIMQAKGSKYLLRRPGKATRGWSADLDLSTADVPLLFVWTSSTVLEAEKAYAPSSYLIYYRYKGNAVNAYDWLITNGYAPPRKEKLPEIQEMTAPPETKDDAESLFTKYKKYKVTPKTEVDDPIPILTINKVSVLHTGELLTISGESKAGKSALTSAIISKVLNPLAKGFNIIETKNSKLPILHFDTEQPIHRHKEIQKHAILRRAGLDEIPSQLMSYNLRRMSVEERKKMVAELAESAKLEFGGVFMIILDGIADFIQDTNDVRQSANVVTWVLEMSSEYNCGVMVVIHLNPMGGKDGFMKQRGHLGSELQRKTDALLVVKKDKMEDLRSILTAHYLRNGGIYDFGKHSIYYDKETGMHQIYEEKSKDDPNQQNLFKNDKYQSLTDLIAGMNYEPAVRELINAGHYPSFDTAKKAIGQLIEFEYAVMTDGKIVRKGNLNTQKLNEVTPDIGDAAMEINKQLSKDDPDYVPF